MVCQSCGSPTAGPGTFCTRCGTQVAAPAYAGAQAPVAQPIAYPPPLAYARPAYTRVTRHLQALGILWFVYGAYRAATGLFGALVLAGLAHNVLGDFGERFGLLGPMWGMPHNSLFGAMAGFVLVFTGLAAILAFITGYGLTTRLLWARTLAIVAAILALFHPIAGTALGIYTLWVLAPNTSAEQYDALAVRT